MDGQSFPCLSTDSWLPYTKKRRQSLACTINIRVQPLLTSPCILELSVVDEHPQSCIHLTSLTYLLFPGRLEALIGSPSVNTSTSSASRTEIRVHLGKQHWLDTL